MSYYIIDAKDVIVDVSSDWDNPPEGMSSAYWLRGQDLYGTALSSYISGDATQGVLSGTFQITRARKKMTTNYYRCDDPYYLRRFRMTLTPLKDGYLQLGHELLDIQTRHNFGQQLAGKQLHCKALRCSICAQFFWGGQWMEADDLAVILHLSIRSLYAIQTQFTVCPQCRSQMVA